MCAKAVAKSNSLLCKRPTSRASVKRALPLSRTYPSKFHELNEQVVSLKEFVEDVEESVQGVVQEVNRMVSECKQRVANIKKHIKTLELQLANPTNDQINKRA